MTTTPTAPGTGTVLATLVRVTLRRFFRGRALWVSIFIGMLPFILAFLLKGIAPFHAVEVVQVLVLALLPPMFVGASIGEELEDRTMTYLWSRPIPRWSIVVGKLMALAPLAMALLVAGMALSHLWFFGQPPPPRAIGALALGTLVIGMMSAGLATLVPRHAMALSIVYLIVFDLPLGAIPASINRISITQQVTTLGTIDGPVLVPVLWLAVIGTLWLVIALWRIRRLEV
jgi:ABC-type Na+ efflux pump permease subunit